ncbi:hypothetical protein RGF97_21255 [Streptomyces roseicoloratus]|uniref:Uncharacterized protein n=1 Tax=Streptomyces roseicoloratus TaxID=2508722 RepID=A0ABY9RZ90_9ACTN|nr:hypothetical protein [Streptomyces roseicoloratus]WMX46846.1 hypothetical protein RGF97_21255 [Streptomyces roseicoloratus]
MLHIPLSVVVFIGFAVLVALIVAAGTVALARWDQRTTPASIMLGFTAFGAALTLMIVLLTFMSGTRG